MCMCVFVLCAHTCMCVFGNIGIEVLNDQNGKSEQEVANEKALSKIKALSIQDGGQQDRNEKECE